MGLPYGRATEKVPPLSFHLHLGLNSAAFHLFSSSPTPFLLLLWQGNLKTVPLLCSVCECVLFKFLWKHQLWVKRQETEAALREVFLFSSVQLETTQVSFMSMRTAQKAIWFLMCPGREVEPLPTAPCCSCLYCFGYSSLTLFHFTKARENKRFKTFIVLLEIKGIS